MGKQSLFTRLRELFDRWRGGIRLGETAVVLGFWGAGISANDLVIACILLTLGLAIALIAVLADPIRSSSFKGSLGFGLILIFGLSGSLVYWRHKADQPPSASAPKPPQLVPAAKLEIIKMQTQVPPLRGYINANFYMKNKGPASAIQFKHSSLVHEFDHELTIQELDNLFGQMAVSLSSMSSPMPSSEIKPDGEYFFSFVGSEMPRYIHAPGRSAFLRQKAGKSRVYVVARIEYRYPLLPEGAWATGERCWFWFQTVVHICPTHHYDVVPEAAFNTPSAK